MIGASFSASTKRLSAKADRLGRAAESRLKCAAVGVAAALYVPRIASFTALAKPRWQWPHENTRLRPDAKVKPAGSCSPERRGVWTWTRKLNHPGLRTPDDWPEGLSRRL
jgi:hypothetical protein